MKRKKMLASVMCFVLALGMFSGCGNAKEKETEATEAKIVEPETTEVAVAEPISLLKDQYFTYNYEVSGMNMTFFFHFYDEIPGIGNVFYAGMCMNQMNFAGTYTVEESEYSYQCYLKYGDEEMASGTVPYTIIFYNWEGSEIDRCGFDGETIYSDMENITGPGGSNILLAKTAADDEKWTETFEAEADMSYLDFVGADDETVTLTMYHNGRYLDLVDVMVEGNWELTSSDSSGIVYTLKPDSDTDNGATVTVSADRTSAVYQAEAGGEVNLVNADAKAELLGTFNGTVPIPGQEVSADLILNVYEDGTCEMIANAFGNLVEIDKGTYEIAEDGFTFNFTFDSAGALSSVVDDTGIVSLQFILAGSDLGDIDQVLTLQTAE